MRKLTAIEFVTLDGVVQAPGGPDEDTSGGFVHGGWIRPYVDPVQSAVIREQMSLPFDLLLGRRTFEIWAPYWPQHPDVWPEVQTATKYVASNSLTAHAWGPSVFLGGDVAGRVTELKRRPGADLHVYGSANLLQTLLKHDLVDAFWLRIHPITLGRGKRLFAGGAMPAAFRVTESQVTSTGVILVSYERAGDVETGRT
ncbi:MAG: dihydrofolate reductase family protein [Trueperaceae bacterium]|nr:dihydrofolate reductase family protein [Trueperaceae bacterium]